MAVILAYAAAMEAVHARESLVQDESGREHSLDRHGLDQHGRDLADGHAELSERDRQILEFEKSWWRFDGSKEEAVRELFGLSATRYYQVLNVLIDTPAALRHEPMLVKRLRRMRTSRQQARTSRRLGVNA